MSQIIPLNSARGGGGANAVAISIPVGATQVVVPYSRNEFTRMLMSNSCTTTVTNTNAIADVSVLLRAPIGKMVYGHQGEGMQVSYQKHPMTNDSISIISETENSFTISCFSRPIEGIIYLS